MLSFDDPGSAVVKLQDCLRATVVPSLYQVGPPHPCSARSGNSLLADGVAHIHAARAEAVENVSEEAAMMASW